MVAQATKQYREVKRKANVGETIRITENANVLGESHHIGKTYVVTKIEGEGWVNTDGKWNDGTTLNLTDDEYVVLEPITTADPLDLIANLSAEVARLNKRVETLEDRLFTPTIGRNECKQITRDEIVAKAKADVEGLALNDEYNEERRRISGKEGPFYVLYVYGTYAEFIVNRDKRTVVCLLRGFRGHRVLEKGIAKAAPDDCFNVYIGKAIALRRALGLDVPQEYTQCPQPTEAKVGDIVFYSDVHGVGEVVNDGECPRGVFDVSNVNKWVGYDRNGEWTSEEITRIIDDSARYE